jgi:hypothetical protein
MCWISCLALLLAVPAPRDERPTVVLVVGAEGTTEYGKQFATWAQRWARQAERGAARVVRVGGESLETEGETDRQRLQAMLGEEAEGGGPLWVVLIGHGTHDGREAKFNLRGPDVSDVELTEWLRPCKRPLAVVNCASASAPFLNRLSGPGRVVVTATRSGSENNFARFGEHLSDAIADPAADLDKDGQTSLLEAFLAASHQVDEFYKQESRLATEHALLDDNGDGLGTPADWFRGVRATRAAKEGNRPDGSAAHQWHLRPSARELALPAEVRARRDRLELEVEALRAQKAALSEDEYYRRLESLLLELAGVYKRRPDEAGGDGKDAGAASKSP